MSEAKILLSWNAEQGLSAVTLRNTTAGISSGCVNVARHYGTLVLVWSPDWLSETEASAIVKDMLLSDEGEPGHEP